MSNSELSITWWEDSPTGGSCTQLGMDVESIDGRWVAYPSEPSLRRGMASEKMARSLGSSDSSAIAAIEDALANHPNLRRSGNSMVVQIREDGSVIHLNIGPVQHPYSVVGVPVGATFTLPNGLVLYGAECGEPMDIQLKDGSQVSSTWMVVEDEEGNIADHLVSREQYDSMLKAHNVAGSYFCTDIRKRRGLVLEQTTEMTSDQLFQIMLEEVPRMWSEAE